MKPMTDKDFQESERWCQRNLWPWPTGALWHEVRRLREENKRQEKTTAELGLCVAKLRKAWNALANALRDLDEAAE